MKSNWKGLFRLGVLLFLLYLAIHYWPTLAGLLTLGVSAAFPLVLGTAVAYAVNILMTFYEFRCYPPVHTPRAQKIRRLVCLLLAYASLFGIVVLIIRMILPELADCVGLLIREAAPLLQEWSLKLNENVDLARLFSASGISLSSGSIDWQGVIVSAVHWLITGLGGVMDSVVTLTSALMSTVFTLIVSFIFSIYLLLQKERLRRQLKKLFQTYLKPRWYSRFIYFVHTLNTCFRRFVVGQCTEAVILGALCIGGMLLFRFPYATMVGCLIGFTALIPVAGAYIGAGVGAFMVFTAAPMRTVLFLVFIVVLQQLEGNLIYPRVVGSSIGLPGIWVLAAVTIGGGILGIVGMLIAVPLTAAFYQIVRADVHRRSDSDASQPPAP